MENISDSSNVNRRNSSHESPPPPLSPASSYTMVQYEPMSMLPNEQLLYGQNEFRDILNTAVQADRQVQRQPEVLGKKNFD